MPSSFTLRSRTVPTVVAKLSCMPRAVSSPAAVTLSKVSRVALDVLSCSFIGILPCVILVCFLRLVVIFYSGLLRCALGLQCRSHCLDPDLTILELVSVEFLGVWISAAWNLIELAVAGSTCANAKDRRSCHFSSRDMLAVGLLASKCSTTTEGNGSPLIGRFAPGDFTQPLCLLGRW